MVPFTGDGLVVCQRIPGRVERGAARAATFGWPARAEAWEAAYAALLAAA